MFLPSREKIVAVLEDVRRLIFPGYFGHKELTEADLPIQVEHLLAEIRESLEEQIYACVCTDRRCPECAEPEQCRREAKAMVEKFLSRIPAVRDMLALDAQAAYDGDPAAKSIDEVIYCYPGYYAVTVYRIAHELLAAGVPLMPRIMTEYAHSMAGTDIHPGARIGKSFFIDHATGVVVGETTRIGDNVKIYQGVTLGARSFPKDERGKVIKGLQRHPTIEDNVTIYPNATILGGKTVIGKGVTVGGNAYVVESVAAESVVGQDRPRLRVVRKKDNSSK
ncbi:MAG: serine acetyltransferase [Phycisphaerae bacterium]|nr:serine acetyltransferase [Phycisphaerae bacterium]